MMWWQWAILLVVAEFVAVIGALLYGGMMTGCMKATAVTIRRSEDLQRLTSDPCPPIHQHD